MMRFASGFLTWEDAMHLAEWCTTNNIPFKHVQMGRNNNKLIVYAANKDKETLVKLTWDFEPIWETEFEKEYEQLKERTGNE